MRDYEATTSQKPILAAREEQIEDELSNGATTTEKFMEKRRFMTLPLRENNDHREIFTVRFNESSPTTTRSSLSSTKRSKALHSSTKKYDEPENVTDGGDTDFTTTYEDLTKKLPVDNGERKTRQRSDGYKGVTTNRGKTRFQNEPGTSEVPEISTTLRHKKPIRVKPIEQVLQDEIVTTSANDDLIDTTTVIDNSEIEQQRPKFKKPPLIATHHPNFGTSTEASRRPAIRPNLNLKQKISSSTTKTKPSEPDVTESENMPYNKTIEVVTSNMQVNKIRPIKVNSPKGTAVQQPIPPTATAWALASLKAPNNTNRIFKKPLNVSNSQEPISKIKPFVTWSTRLQKTTEDNANATSVSNNTLVTESNESFTEIPTKYLASSANRLTPETTSTESLLRLVSTSLAENIPNKNDSTISIVGGDTDQNKYEIYGSQKPDIENTTTVIETLRPLSSTMPSESQNLNLLLVTSYKSILENDNTSENQKFVFTSSETPIESMPKKEIMSNATNTPKTEIITNIFSTSTNKSNNFQNNAETPITENVSDHKFSATQKSTETFSKTPELLFDYTEDQNNNKIPTTTARAQLNSSNTIFSFSHDMDLNQNHSTTTEHYIESIKTKVDDKITKSTDNDDSLEMVDFTHMFSSERPILSSTDGTELITTVSEKTTSGRF